MDAWLYRLRDAYNAGYYRTEPAEGAQSPFPWQNRTCQDCPFWSNRICRVYGEYRSEETHTCAYFDQCNRDAGAAIIRERERQGFGKWWDWFSDRDTAR
ncbi:MAG TPA: hypothetical protein VF221_07860 [Chloroflexota bacterium]